MNKIFSLYLLLLCTHLFSQKESDYLVYPTKINNRWYLCNGEDKKVNKLDFDGMINNFPIHIIAKRKDKWYIFKRNSSIPVYKNIQTIAPTNLFENGVQVIVNGKLAFFNFGSNKIQDSIVPNIIKRVGVCGTVPKYRYDIFKDSSLLFKLKIIAGYNIWEDKEEYLDEDSKPYKATFILPNARNYYFLDKQMTHSGNSNSIYNEGFSSNLMFQENIDSTFNLIKFKIDSNKINIDTIISNVERIDFGNNYGYKSFNFIKNKSVSNFPYLVNKRYKRLNNFYGYFAYFELPNGKKGWVDKAGNEYYF